MVSRAEIPTTLFENRSIDINLLFCINCATMCFKPSGLGALDRLMKRPSSQAGRPSP